MALGVLRKGKRMRIHLITATAAVAGILLLAGCTTPDDVDEPTPTPTAVQGPDRPEGFPTLGEPVGDDKADFESQLAAVQAAETTMTVFATHDRDYNAWWAELSPLLTVEAQEAWAYTDPRMITVSQLTGPAAIVDAPSSTLVIVDVPTDIGTWRLELVRAAEVDTKQGEWKAFTLMPPETPNDQFVG